MAVVLGGLHGADLIGGHADGVVSKSLGLGVPLGNGVAVLDHVVVVTELTLGSGVVLADDLALGAHGDLGLDGVGQSGENLAVGADSSGAELGVHLDHGVAVFGISSGHGLGGVGDGGHAQREGAGDGGEGGALLVVAGLHNGLLEGLEADGAGSEQLFVNGDVVALFVDAGLDVLDLVSSLADDPLLKVLDLLKPLERGVGVLDHVVVILQIALGGVGRGGIDLAAGDVHLVLRAVDAAEHDLAFAVGDDRGDGGVDLSFIGVGAVKADAHAHAKLVLGFGGLGGRSFGSFRGGIGGGGSGLAAAGSQREQHARQKENGDCFFHCVRPLILKFFAYDSKRKSELC